MRNKINSALYIIYSTAHSDVMSITTITIIINMTTITIVMKIIRVMKLTHITFVCKTQKYFWY